MADPKEIELRVVVNGKEKEKRVKIKIKSNYNPLEIREMLQDAADVSNDTKNVVKLFENNGDGAMVRINFEDIDPANGPFLLDIVTGNSLY